MEKNVKKMDLEINRGARKLLRIPWLKKQKKESLVKRKKIDLDTPVIKKKVSIY